MNQEIVYIDIPDISDIEEKNNEIVLNIPQFKLCCDCQVDKPVTSFYPHSSCKGGYQKRCKDCHKIKYAFPINANMDAKNKLLELKEEIVQKKKEIKEVKSKSKNKILKDSTFLYKYTIEVSSDLDNDLIEYFNKNNIKYRKFKYVKLIK